MGVIILNPTQLFAGDEEDIKKQILANNAYAKKNNQAADEYSVKGALEFWHLKQELVQTIFKLGLEFD